MKSIFTILIVSLFSVVKSQTVILNESFENYQDFSINNFGNWICLDLDQLDTWTLGGDPAPPSNWFATWPNAGAKMAFQIFNPSQSNVSNDATGITGEIRNFDPHTGNKYAGSWAGTVSYTHLDVYKRQGSTCNIRYNISIIIKKCVCKCRFSYVWSSCNSNFW